MARRAVVAVVLFAVAVLVVLLAALALVDPFHLRQARWFTAALVFLAILLVMLALMAVTRRWLRGFVLGLGVVAMLAWVALVWYASGLLRPTAELTSVADAGGHRLVVLRSAAATGSVYAVVVRSGAGPFEQESLVYQGLDQGLAPDEVRFVDPETIEVRTGPCDYRSSLSGVTLDVDPVHEPLLSGAC